MSRKNSRRIRYKRVLGLKNCVIFASWVPNITRGKEYIKYLEEFFVDYDIYVGINPNSDNQWKQCLSDSKLNVIYEDVSEELSLKTDASAYQTGLKLLKNSKKQYGIVHFIHTKGMSYPDSNSSHTWNVAFTNYFVDYCKIKNNIENKIKDNIGGCGGWASIWFNANSDGHIKELDKFYKFKYRAQNIMLFMTFYCIRFDIIENFINCCDSTFFSNRLNLPYFFEFGFPHIVTKNGFELTTNYWWDRGAPYNEQNYNLMLNEFLTQKEKIC